jgi:hypothetical protein
MAKLGTVFVELLLDDKVYKKNLSEQLTSTTATAKGIEQSWKVLGQRSDDIYNAQRRSYENALTLIKNSHNATKQDIIRAEQAAADKIRRINEQQYGHQTSMIEGLKKNWLAATAAIGAAMIVVSKAWDLAKIGAEYAEQQGILNNLSTKYKTTADEIVKAMQKASDGTVANADLMKIALGGISKGLNPEQLTELSNAAKMLADVTGETTTQALTTLSEALETGRMKALKHYAGTIDLKDAFGELTDKLTATEKAQAMYALIIQHTTELQAQQTQVVDAAADKIERMEASYNNAKLAAGNFFKTVVAGIYDMVTALASVPVDYDMSGMGAQPLYMPKQANKSAKTVGGEESGDLSAADLSMLNLELLKRNVTEREKAAKAVEKHTKAIKDNHKAIKEQQEQLRAETGIIYNIEDSYRATEKAIEDMTEAAQEGFELTMDSIKKIEFDELKKNLKSISDSFGDLGNACMDLSSIYEEGSKSARMWEEAARAFEVAQKAVAVANAVATIANQGLGDPYTAFARIAAMAATMASLLATIGESVGGGGGSSSSATAKYTSTALGSDEASQSASKSYELLKDSYSMQYERLTKIYGEMKDLNSSITGLVTSIVRTGGMNGLTYATGVSLPGYSSISTYAGKQVSQLVAAASADPFTAMTHQIIEGLTGGKFGDNVSKWINSVFGGGTETKLKQQGISFGNTSLSSILGSGGIDAQYYSKIKTTTEGGWFGSDSSKTTFMYDKLDAGTSNMLNKVFGSLSNTFLSLAEGFGIDTQQTLDYVFAETKLNLKGKTAEEINTILTDYFNTTADNAAQALFGNLLGKYQQLNEGLMETATRVLRNKEVIAEYLEKTNQAFTGTTEQIIGFTESLVDLGGTLDDLTDNINTYMNAFYSDAERQSMLQQDLMEAMGGNMPGSRSGFRAMVEGLDLTTEAGQRAYVTMMNLAGSFDEYFSYIEDEAEKALQAAEEARQKRIAEITSEFELRKSALTDRYNQQLQAAQDRLSAITEIANKLTAARERMKVQDAIIEAANFRGAKSNLMRGIWNDDSLNTLTGINPGQYSSRQDYLRDYYDIYNQLSALEQDALSKKSAAERTIDWLKSQYEIDLQNLDLQRQQAESLVVIKQVCTRTNKGLQEFDDGGIASGPSSGYEARLHGTELVISPRKGYSATVKSNNEDVVNSINELRAEVRGILVSMSNTAEKSYDIIDNWDRIGLPAEQT